MLYFNIILPSTPKTFKVSFRLRNFWRNLCAHLSFPQCLSRPAVTSSSWIDNSNSIWCRSQWPRCLRRRSAAARLLRFWVRIPPGAWTFVCCECCVLSGRGLCDELITRSEESYRLWCVVVRDLEASWMRRLWPNGGCCNKGNKIVSDEQNQLYSSAFIFTRPVLLPHSVASIPMCPERMKPAGF